MLNTYRTVLTKLNFAIICALLVFPAAFFVVPWLKGNVYTSFDLSHIMVPIEDLYARYQRAGQLPIWTPEFQAGSPMMANGIESFLYLPHIFLRQWLPGIWVANISLLLHLWLANVGMWLLMRYQKFSKSSSFMSAMMFAVGGYFVGRITLPQIFLPAAWLPLIVLTFRYWWNKPTIRRAILFAAIVSAQVISGHIQMVIYTGLLLTVLGIVIFAQRFKLLTKKRIITLLLAIVMICALTAVHILPVVELLPISKRAIPLEGEEAFDISYPASQILTWFTPTVFGNQATYVGAKNEPELLLFFGISGVFLGLIGLLSRRVWKDWLGLSSISLIIISFILALGGYSPVYRFLHSLPVMSGMANPGRAIVLIHLSWSILVGYGLTAIQEWDAKTRRRNALIAGVILVFGVASLIYMLPIGRMRDAAWATIEHQRLYLLVISLICLFVVVWPKRWTGYYSGFLIAIVILELIQGGRHFNPVMPVQAYTNSLRMSQLMPAASDSAPRVYAQKNFSPVAMPDFQPGPGPVIGPRTIIQQSVTPQLNNLSEVKVWLTWDSRQVRDGAITLNVKDDKGKILRTAVVSSLKINDAEHTSFVFNPISDSKRPLIIEITTPFKADEAPKAVIYHNSDQDYNPTGRLSICRKACVEVKSDSQYGWDLAFVLNYKDTSFDIDRELLVPTFGEGFGYNMISGHLQLQLLPITKYMYELGERNDTYNEKVLENRTLLDRMSVGTIVGAYAENRSLQGFPGVTLKGIVPLGNKFIQVYRNDQAMPRIGFAKQVKAVRSDDEALKVLVAKEIDEDTVTAKGLTEPNDFASDGNPLVTIAKNLPTNISVNVSSTSPQLLVLRDAMYPGWQASIDNKPAQIHIVDSLFKGVLVPQGSHTVTFNFVSRTFYIGAAVSSVAWLIAVIGLLSLLYHKNNE